jgi:hypothetical protein
MNISRKRVRSTRESRESPSLACTSVELPKAPIDRDYGIDGLAHILEKIAGSRADSTAIIKSMVSGGRSYVIGESYNPNTEDAKVFVACLKDDGMLDNSFNNDGIFDFNKTASAAYKSIESIVEDDEGNLLIAVLMKGQSASHLWKLSAKGQPDLTFGEGKGYVDTHDLIDGDLLLEHLALAKDRIFVTALRRGPQIFEPVVIGLNSNGALREDFGVGGFLDVSKLIPQTDSHIIDGIASFTPPSGAQHLVLAWYLVREDDAYSVTTALTTDGKVDNAFGKNGHHWSDPWIINNGFSVDRVANRITFYGELYDLDEEISHPTVYRIDYSGMPAIEFNGGEALKFDQPGGWYAGVETGDGLVGYGSFYTYMLAFSLTSAGKFDTNFVPPFGYGQVGAQLPDDGFYTSKSTVTLDPGNKRLLINGRDEEARGSTVPSVIAVSLRTA